MLREEVNHGMAHVEGRKVGAKFHAEQVHLTWLRKEWANCLRTAGIQLQPKPGGGGNKIIGIIDGSAEKTLQEK